MQRTFSLLFYIKRSKADSNGMANVYLRITVNGKRAELSIRRKVELKNGIIDLQEQSGTLMYLKI